MTLQSPLQVSARPHGLPPFLEPQPVARHTQPRPLTPGHLIPVLVTFRGGGPWTSETGVLSELLGFLPSNVSKGEKDFHPHGFLRVGGGQSSPGLRQLPDSPVRGRSISKHQNHGSDQKLTEAKWPSSN